MTLCHFYDDNYATKPLEHRNRLSISS